MYNQHKAGDNSVAEEDKSNEEEEDATDEHRSKANDGDADHEDKSKVVDETSTVVTCLNSSDTMCSDDHSNSSGDCSENRIHKEGR